ncbi:MAG: RNA methyltransferase [Alphaproteobacteria bacterium]|nr:RNA methyltransferase [Alphaproteobacteria bacterium]
MRGYFGIGVEGISKVANIGSIWRSAHAFGASFVFTIGAVYAKQEGEKSDTSSATEHVPLHEYAGLDDFLLPKDCRLVGVELVPGAIELPSFHHPSRAAYVLGPERGVLSPGLLARCDYVVQIPTAFCVNVGIAAALVMYDRMLTLQRFAPRPVHTGGPDAPLPPPVFGQPILRRPRKPTES